MLLDLVDGQHWADGRKEETEGGVLVRVSITLLLPPCVAIAGRLHFETSARRSSPWLLVSIRFPYPFGTRDALGRNSGCQEFET